MRLGVKEMNESRGDGWMSLSDVGQWLRGRQTYVRWCDWAKGWVRRRIMGRWGRRPVGEWPKAVRRIYARAWDPRDVGLGWDEPSEPVVCRWCREPYQPLVEDGTSWMVGFDADRGLGDVECTCPECGGRMRVVAREKLL